MPAVKYNLMNFKKELFCEMKKDNVSDLNLVQQITHEIWKPEWERASKWF